MLVRNQIYNYNARDMQNTEKHVPKNRISSRVPPKLELSLQQLHIYTGWSPGPEEKEAKTQLWAREVPLR